MNPHHAQYFINQIKPKAEIPGVTNVACDIPELCDGDGNFVGAIRSPQQSLACDIPELCDENGNFVGSIRSPTKSLVCDIPELCDENGNFVGKSANVPT